jgi:hypothetical protein
LPDWPARLLAKPALQANQKCEFRIQLDGRIISPLIGIAHLGRCMRRQRNVAAHGYT